MVLSLKPAKADKRSETASFFLNKSKPAEFDFNLDIVSMKVSANNLRSKPVLSFCLEVVVGDVIIVDSFRHKPRHAQNLISMVKCYLPSMFRAVHLSRLVITHWFHAVFLVDIISLPEHSQGILILVLHYDTPRKYPHQPLQKPHLWRRRDGCIHGNINGITRCTHRMERQPYTRTGENVNY